MADTMQEILDYDLQHGHADFMKVVGPFQAAGVLHDSWYTAGRPVSAGGVYSGLNGELLASSENGLYFPEFNTGSEHAHLNRLQVSASGPGTLILIDRIWQNQITAVTTTTAQNIIMSVTGRGVADGAKDLMLGLSCSVATTNGAPITNTTVTYYNSDATAGRTATLPSWPANAVAGTFVPFNLQAGDLGVSRCASITLGTSYVTGTLHLVLFRIIAFVGINSPTPMKGHRFSEHNALATSNFNAYLGTTPSWLWMPTGTGAVSQMGRIGWSVMPI